MLEHGNKKSESATGDNSVMEEQMDRLSNSFGHEGHLYKVTGS